jgi:AcrR family transcriptional regulator
MGPEETGKPKGRPKSAPLPYPSGPMDEWLSDLSPTAHHILDAARRLLLSKGYDALTLEAVALEAGEDKGTITRHFGSKAGLIQALFDDMGNEIFTDLEERATAMPPGDERLHTLIRSYARLASDRQLALGMFELAPHVIREPILRDRLANLYAWYLKSMREESGMAAAAAGATAYQDRQDIEALAAVIMAVIDGISLQVSLDPASVDVDRVFALVDLFVSAVLDGRLRTQGHVGPDDHA